MHVSFKLLLAALWAVQVPEKQGTNGIHGNTPKTPAHKKIETNTLIQNILNILYVLWVYSILLRCACRFCCVLCKFARLFTVDHSATTTAIKAGHVCMKTEA